MNMDALSNVMIGAHVHLDLDLPRVRCGCHTSGVPTRL